VSIKSWQLHSAVVVADASHVCLLGHVTADELKSKLAEVDVSNGFANRHLFSAVERSKLLPSGGNLTEETVYALGSEIRDVLSEARKVGVMERSSGAEVLWEELYRDMADDSPPGAVGKLISRDAAQVLRLSVVYALTDASATISERHLEAAWSTWQHCRRSVESIFGQQSGDPVADRLLMRLRTVGEEGMSAAQQHQLFGRHVTADRLMAARNLLVDLGFAAIKQVSTRGRSASVLTAVEQVVAK
jgi:hypothetical protein